MIQKMNVNFNDDSLKLKSFKIGTDITLT